MTDGFCPLEFEERWTRQQKPTHIQY